MEKLDWEPNARKLTFKAPLAKEEEAAVKALLVMEAGKEVIEWANKEIQSQTVEIFRSPSERGLDFRVPQMALLVNGDLQLFDDPEVLDYPWKLPLYEAHLSDDERAVLGLASKAGEGGAIDVEAGKVTIHFLPELHQELALAYQPEHVTEAALPAGCAAT